MRRLQVIIDSAQCTGCMACYNACSKQAICMEEGFLGALYPKVDVERCVDCGACDKACPVLNLPPLNFPQDCFAVRLLNQDEYHTTTSGGLATAFSAQVVDWGGVTYGCAAVGMCVKHVRCEFRDELDQLKGSKYVQSDIGETYRNIKKDVLAGKDVLFIGLPCQVAGLKTFLHKEYDNLYCVDLICHGVPSQCLLKEYVQTQCQGIKLNTIKNLKFRAPNTQYTLSFQGENIDGHLLVYSSTLGADCMQNSFYNTFWSGSSFRENCYSCRYACPERVSDITIGDFWGCKDIDFLRQCPDGCSVALLNTEKGLRLFGTLKNVTAVRQPISDAIAGNAQLNAPTKKTMRTCFFRIVARYFSFETAYRIAYADRIGWATLKKTIKRIACR